MSASPPAQPQTSPPRGPPPGSLPPGVRPPGVGPPPAGQLPPGVRPPGVGPPPGALPPGVRPPGVGPPPGAVAAGGALPPGVRPPQPMMLGPDGKPIPMRGPPIGPDGKPLVAMARPPQGVGPPPGATAPLGPDGRPMQVMARPPPQQQQPVQIGPDGRPIAVQLPPGVRPPGVAPPGQQLPQSIPAPTAAAQPRPPMTTNPPISAQQPQQHPTQQPISLPAQIPSPQQPIQQPRPAPQQQQQPPPAQAAAPQQQQPAARQIAPSSQSTNPSSASAQATFASQAKLRQQQAMEQKIQDIWTKASEEKQNQFQFDSSSQQQREATLLFLGSQSSGKSTLITSYMYKDSKEASLKTTVGFDYKYTRTSVAAPSSSTISTNATSNPDEKSISHFYELGSGHPSSRTSSLTSLTSIILTPETILNTMIILTVDLSQLNHVVSELQWWLQYIKTQCDDVIKKLRDMGGKQSVLDQLTQNSKKRWGIGAGLAESAITSDTLKGITLLPIPILICANKFDTISTLEPEKLRVLSRTLRAIAHSYGCSLVYTTKQSAVLQRDVLLKFFKSRINEHVMNTSLAQGKKLPPPAVDHTQYIAVVAGQDSWSTIGDAPGVKSSSSTSPVQSWLTAYAKVFDTKETNEEEEKVQPISELSAEKSIDTLVAQREEDLKRLQREIGFKRRLNAEGTVETSTQQQRR